MVEPWCQVCGDYGTVLALRRGKQKSKTGISYIVLVLSTSKKSAIAVGLTRKLSHVAIISQRALILADSSICFPRGMVEVLARLYKKGGLLARL